VTRATVLDFGMGNLRSVAKALERAGASVEVAPEVDPRAGLLVVPGQGAFGSCVVNLGERLEAVRTWIEQDRPYLGICLGLQVLFAGSDEDAGAKGAAIVDGHVRRLPAGVKLPHIGWNEVEGSGPLFDGIEPGERFYFVHSFYADPEDDAVVSAWTDYGVRFASAVARGRMLATQFHPEKSGDPGHRLLENVVRAAS